MQNQEVESIEEVAAHLMSGLSAGTVEAYRRELRRWYAFMRRVRKGLRAFDGDAATRWAKTRSGKDRSTVFPLRCVELLQQLKPESVSPDFYIPRSHWKAATLRYRESVMSEDRIRALTEICIGDMESVTELTRETVLSFWVLLAIRTGMNIDSLRQLPRDCLTDEGDGAVLRWYKGRSTGSMSDFYPRGFWEPVEIIGRAQELASDPEYLWVVKGSKTRPYQGQSSALRAWCAAKGVAPFTLEEIRPAMATILFEKNGGNPMDVKNYLHHRNLSTTLLYLSENAVRPRVEQHWARALDKLARRCGLPDEGTVA